MSALADGELRSFRRFRVVRHLAACDGCRAVYRSLLATIEGLRSLGRLEPAPQPLLADFVLERLRREPEGGLR